MRRRSADLVLCERLAVRELVVELLARELFGPEAEVDAHGLQAAQHVDGQRWRWDWRSRFADVIDTEGQGEEEEGPSDCLPVADELLCGIHG